MDGTFDVDLDRLEVVRSLGAGAFGEVHLAVRRLPDGGAWPVALKVLREADPRRTERFRREAELTARLDHPGIVRVHGAGSFRGRPAIVYGYVEGARPLHEAARTLPLATRLACVREVASALAYAHERGVVHRDVKAENVLVDPDGRTLLADFGLAVGLDSKTLTQTGQLLGTPYAMSPEQLVGKEATAASDVWGLGVLLHLVVTGERPFGGDSWTTLAAEVLRGDAPAPSARARDLPAGIDALAAWALAKEPADRPSAAEVAAALEAALVGAPAPARPWSRALPGLLALAGLAAALAAAAVASARRPPEVAAAPETSVASVTSAAPVASVAAVATPGGFVGWKAQLAERNTFTLSVEERAVRREGVGHRLRLEGALGPYSTESTIQLDDLKVGMLTLTGTALRVEELSGLGQVFDSKDTARPTGDGPNLEWTSYAEELAHLQAGLLTNPHTGLSMGRSGFPRRPRVDADAAAWSAALPDDQALVAALENLLQLACLDDVRPRSRRLALTPADVLQAAFRLVEVEPGLLRVVAGPLERPTSRKGRSTPLGETPTFDGRVRLVGGRVVELSFEVAFDTAARVPYPDAVRRRVTASLRLGPTR